MLTITQVSGFGACAQPDPSGLFKKLTNIKVLNTQIISDEDAHGVNDELIATVRCNTEDAARGIIVPAVAIAGFAALISGLVAFGAMRSRDLAGTRTRRRR